MPSSTLGDLLEAYSRVSTSNRAVLEQFAHVARLFHRHGIKFLVLKGADVISRLYGIRGSRPLSDVDLLVYESDLPAIDRLLTRQGFVQQIDGNPSYRSSGLGLSLDLVTTLWYLDAQGLAEVWSRAIMRPFPPDTISCLATEDLLIHLTAYAVIHRGQMSAAFSQDVALLVEKEDPRWPAITSQAIRWGLKVPLYHGFNHVRSVFPSIAIPDAVFTALAPSNRREHALAWLLTKLVTGETLPEIGHLLLFLTQRPGSRLAWLRGRICPNQAFLTYRYGPAGGTTPLKTRLRRVFTLTIAALRLSGRLFRRLVYTSSRPVL